MNKYKVDVITLTETVSTVVNTQHNDDKYAEFYGLWKAYNKGHMPDDIIGVNVIKFDICYMADDIIEKMLAHMDESGRVSNVYSFYPEDQAEEVSEAIGFLQKMGVLRP